MKQMLSFTLNGLTVEALAKPTDTLLDLLREQLGVTGPKRGCDSGDCGACMVLLDGRAVNACLEAMEEHQVSIEGETRPLPEPFFVIATQNPPFQIGTFPLPESQLIAS